MLGTNPESAGTRSGQEDGERSKVISELLRPPSARAVLSVACFAQTIPTAAPFSRYKNPPRPLRSRKETAEIHPSTRSGQYRNQRRIADALWLMGEASHVPSNLVAKVHVVICVWASARYKYRAQRGPRLGDVATLPVAWLRVVFRSEGLRFPERCSTCVFSFCAPRSGSICIR